MRGIQKRKFADVDDETLCYSSSSLSPPSSFSSPSSSGWESDVESSPPDEQDFTPHSPPPVAALPIRPILRRPRLAVVQSNVRFDQVTVFSFPRCQGFTSVPSHGGATLGMTRKHSALQRYSLAEHALEQRRRRREKLRERRREEKLEWITSGFIDQREADRLTVDQIPDGDADAPVSDADVRDGGFLQPFTSRQRQAVLQAAGVKRIEREEKRQLHALRLSREACGCDCRGFCEPETCACSLAGIKCQVDRLSFPCGCTKDGCGNTQGRTEFNPRRVQTHYIHTTMRLELEKRLQDETRGQQDQTGLPEDLQEFEEQDQAATVRSVRDKTCPFEFTMEEDCLPLSMPAAPSFHFIPERLVVEENSCSSDMTESSYSSSDSDTRLSVSKNLCEADRGSPDTRSICDDDNSSTRSQQRHVPVGEPLTQQHGNSSTDSAGTLTVDTFTDNTGRTSLTSYLDENANQPRDFFDDDSLDGFPHTPSPTVDYSSGTYMDLSLSSDSDLEFFDSDYTSGPLHSSFKLHRHPDSLCHLQLLSSVNLPQHESSTYLLESLIGLTEASPEQG